MDMIIDVVVLDESEDDIPRFTPAFRVRHPHEYPHTTPSHTTIQMPGLARRDVESAVMALALRLDERVK